MAQNKLTKERDEEKVALGEHYKPPSIVKQGKASVLTKGGSGPSSEIGGHYKDVNVCHALTE